MTSKPLKLIAKDVEGIEVISAVLQDSIVPFCDITHQAAEKTFIAIAQRFCWDADEEGEGGFHRICCAVTVRGVTAVQLQGINQADKAQMLDLLALTVQDKALVFIFAGDARLKLTLEDWSLTIHDFGESWPTANKPSHGA